MTQCLMHWQIRTARETSTAITLGCYLTGSSNAEKFLQKFPNIDIATENEKH